MRSTAGLVLALLAFAAGDAWDKVREAKSGTELRIYRSGEKQPVMARMDELTEENLVVVIKNEQVAIPREQIDRIDYRPAREESRLRANTTTTPGTNVGSPEERSGPAASGPTASTTSSVTVEGKGRFQTLYRRLGAPKPH